MRTRAIWVGCWVAGGLLSGGLLTGGLLADGGVPLVNFAGAEPLAGWTVSRDSGFPGADGSLALGPGHAGRAAVFEYRFACGSGTRCGGAVEAVWTPAKPVAFKHRGALSLWIRVAPEVKITLLVGDKTEGTRRYPFEATTIEHPGVDWRQVVIPLAAKSTGYWDEDHSGAPQRRMTSIGILAEPRYAAPMRGAVGLDDVRLLDSADQSFALGVGTSLGVGTGLAPAPPGSAQLGPRWGVNIHTLGDERMLDVAHEAGFGFVRADMLWRDIERNGRYRFQAYDRLLNALERRAMGALWILDYGHPQHGGDPPRSADDVAAFARYAEAAAAHFKGRNVRFEVWNEPNVERFWQPHPNAQEYARLLREAVAAIHRADPSAKVASGGLSRIDLPFLAATIAAGGASEVNAGGVHPYRRSGPESLAAELPLVRQLLVGAAGEKVEIWDTEWGYASYDYFSKNLKGDGHSAPGRERQAVLACREALTIWALGLPVAVWYDLRDDGEDAKNPEHNYGLLDAKGDDKPAMKALRVLTGIAKDHNFAGMVPDVPDGAHAMRLDGGQGRVFVVWSEQPDARIAVRVPLEGFLSATDLMGEALKLKKAGHGEMEIPLAEMAGPIYLRFTGR